MSRLPFIDQQRPSHPVQQLCQVLGVVPSRYYDCRHRPAAGAVRTSEPACAQTSIADYFDYYNHERRHSCIGYRKPYQFHQQQLNNITQFSPA